MANFKKGISPTNGENANFVISPSDRRNDKQGSLPEEDDEETQEGKENAAKEFEEKNFHLVTSRFCNNKLGNENIHIYTIHTPVLGHVMKHNVYNEMVSRDGMNFEKLMRLCSIGLMKVLTTLEAEKINEITPLEMEISISVY